MATNSLATNINQAVSDFHSIKNAIVAKGVSVPNGTPTSDYASKIGQISGDSSPVQSVDTLPTASADNVNQLYYLTTDENIYKSVGTKQTFVDGQTIDSDIIFDTTQNPEDYVAVSLADMSNSFLIGLDENKTSKYWIICLEMFSQNHIEGYGKCYALYMQEYKNPNIDINNVYYINCDTLSVDQFNENFGSVYGISIDHFGWQKNIIPKEQINGLIINGLYNPNNFAYYETYAMVQENPTSGTLNITENGNYDVKQYANASVNVESEQPSGTLNITANGTYDVAQYASANVQTTDMLQTRVNNTNSCSRLFYGDKESNLSYISGLDTSNVTDMSSMFYSCTSLTTIPALNTSKVTNMSYMFNSCSSLTTIPALNTSNVTNMGNMFASCSKLTTIPVLNTSNVTDMNSIFASCKSLTTIPALNTSKVTNMSGMFNNCPSLTTIPLFDTSKVAVMNSMFAGCSKLTTIPALDTSKVTNLLVIFNSCSNLQEIHMTGMKVSFDISASTKFTREALVEILGNLATVSSTQKLTMGSTNLAKLTDSDKTIATNKGWTLA